ncbi:hypothetical protein AAG906_007134 [Vitis piasezkii]
MGNCFALCILSKRRVLWVVKRDGKMIQFRGPILVKDVLVNFSGLGVGVSREALQHLPSDYELKIGKVYYLLPCPCSSGGSVSAPEVSSMADDGGQKGSGMKRIKVVITKQQLQDLLSKQISLEELLLSQSVDLSSPRNWKPKLDPIPEGIETPFFSSALILSFSQLSGSCRRVLYELKLLPDHESFSSSSFFCSPFITSKSSSTDTLTSSFDSPGISNRILISFSSRGMPPSPQTSGPLRPSFGAWSSLETRGPTALEIEPNLCYYNGLQDASLFSPVASALTRASLERLPWREEGKKAEHGAPPPPLKGLVCGLPEAKMKMGKP